MADEAVIKRELPGLLRDDLSLRLYLLDLLRQYSADRATTERRFDRVLETKHAAGSGGPAAPVGEAKPPMARVHG